MKILFVAPYLPSRIRVRPFNFIKHLKEMGHSIHFCGLEDPYSSDRDLEELRNICESVELFRLSIWRSLFNVIIGLFYKTSLQTAYARSIRLKKTIRARISTGSYDILHMEHIRTGSCLPQDRNIPALFDSVDCITALYRQFSRSKASLPGRWLSRVEAYKTARYEAQLVAGFDGAVIATNNDRSRLIQIAAEQKRNIPEIRMISNGVDSAYFKPESKGIESGLIVFSGKMGYAANALAARHFVQDILPLINRKRPEARFTIVGANPPRDIRKLGRREGIDVTGSVEDIRYFIDKAEVIVCPLKVAVGIQNKILEALSMAKPVVAYREVVNSLQSPPEPPVLSASDAGQFAENVCRLFEDESLKQTLQIQARNYVERFYDWGEKTKELERFYRDITDARPL